MKKSIFLFFAAILCAMSAKAYDQAAVDLYFDNSTSKWTNCYVSVGHTGWTAFYDMERVSGTQYLWKLPANFNNGNPWGGASGWVVSVDKWEGYPKAEDITVKYVWHGDKNVTKLQTTAWANSNIYKADGTESVSKDGTTKTVYKVTSYTKSDYTVTISTVEGGTLTVKDYDNNAVATGASKIHLTVLKFSAVAEEGYIFDGVQINNGSTTTTISAANISSETYTLTSNVTITPVWKATTSTVTVTANATNGTVAGAGVYEEGVSVTLTATPADGYKFVNWTVGDAEVSKANPYTFTAETDVTVTANFEELPKETIYFVNNKGWNTVNAYAWNKPANINNGWPGVAATKTEEKVAGFDVYSFTATEGQYTHVIFNTDGSQTADLVWTAGKYYWMGADTDFAGATKEEVESTLATPIPDVWTIVGAEKLMGVPWDLNASANNMQLQQDGSYILTRDDISLAKGDYEYKAVKDHSYNVAIPQNGNQKLTIETAGIYDITFTLKDSKLTTVATLVKAEVIIPTVFVAGKNLNKWSTTANELILSNDSLTASATIALKEGTDSIKMVVGGNWLGNNGTLTRENDGQAWTFKLEDGNCAIVADIAGNYVFTWNFEKNQLTITYPELPTYNVTVTVNPADAGTVEGAGEYKEGTQVTLTATAAEGYEFVNWTVGEEVVAETAEYTFTVTADVALVANFKEVVVEPTTVTLTFDLEAEDTRDAGGTYIIYASDYTLRIYGYDGAGTYQDDPSTDEDAGPVLFTPDGSVPAVVVVTVDEENKKEVMAVSATSADGSIVYNLTINISLPATNQYSLFAMNDAEAMAEDWGEDGESFIVYVVSGAGTLNEEPVEFELNVDELGNIEGVINGVLVMGTATSLYEEEGYLSVTGTAMDEASNTYNIEMWVSLTSEEVEIVITAEENITLYNLNLEVMGNMAMVTAGGDAGVSFQLANLTIMENHYGLYSSDSFSNVWYGATQLQPYGEGQYSPAGFIVSFISKPDAEGKATKYNFTLYAGDGTTVALDNIDATVAPVKVVENGQLIIIKNGVQYNAQGAVIK